MDIETTLGVVGAGRVSVRSNRPSAAANPLKTTLRTSPDDYFAAHPLSAAERKIAASLGLSEEEFARHKERSVARAERKAKSPYGLAATQREIAGSLGLSERQFAGAAGPLGHVPREEAGLLHAHHEIDRAHAATYDENHTNAPDRELLNGALAELKAYNPDDDNTYDHLLKGVVYAARLLNRVAPAYADQKRID